MKHGPIDYIKHFNHGQATENCPTITQKELFTYFQARISIILKIPRKTVDFSPTRISDKKEEQINGSKGPSQGTKVNTCY